MTALYLVAWFVGVLALAGAWKQAKRHPNG